jgi:hypothetical protein
MADIRSPRLLYIKGTLFLLLGVLASAILLAEHPNLRVALLLAIAVWSFARAYYFAFYVIEHYIDSEYKFAGLFSFIRYLARRPGGSGRPATPAHGDQGPKTDSTTRPILPLGGPNRPSA